jgi:hypothetical protein
MAEVLTSFGSLEANRRQLQRHREMLAVACFIVLASFLLEVRPGSEVGLHGVQFLKLPPLCLSMELFGIRCPGCGLTHSFIYLAHGQWHAAWQAHRLGWLLAGMVLLQIPYRIHALYAWPETLISLEARKRIGLCLIALLVGNWALQILP